MKRAERRSRTERKRQKRVREWDIVMQEPHRKPGIARKRSLFDCGKGNCSICNTSTKRPVTAFNHKQEIEYMSSIKQDWASLGGSLEGGLKELLNELIDGAVTDLDGPVRDISTRLAMATKRQDMELVMECRDQLAMIVVEKGLYLNSFGGEDVFESMLGMGMTALVNGAIGGLGALKVVN